MIIKNISLYSQKFTLKELNHCKKIIHSSKIPSEITALNEKIKSLEPHCQQFKKMHVEWKKLNHQIDQKMNQALSGKHSSKPPTPFVKEKGHISAPLSSFLESMGHSGEWTDIWVDSSTLIRVRMISKAPKKKTTSKDFSKLIPYMGLALGTVSGLAERFISSRNLDFKDKKLVKTIFQQFPPLEVINRLKQSEIKHFSLFMPLLPLAAQIVRHAVMGSKDQSLVERFKTSLTTRATIEQKVYTAAAILGILGAACYPKEWAEEYFDPSGHIMLKTLLTTLTAKTLSAALNSTESKSAIIGSTALYGIQAITDAVLVHATVSVCHTVPELAAGFAAAFTISALARKAIETLQPAKL